MSTIQVSFSKGHGTQNDFIVVPNADGSLRLSASQVAWLCHRHAGVGADGVIVVTPCQFSEDPTIRELADEAGWFMDYRNADGSAAEMCGNGTRVFAEYLVRQGWESGPTFAIATRSGVKRVAHHEAGWAVNLGEWKHGHAGGLREPRSVQVGGLTLPGLDFSLGNPHTVAFLEAEHELTALDLTSPPVVTPAPGAGTNVEVVCRTAPNAVRMRVFERGVGETRSCGTGAAAAALAAAERWGTPEGTAWQVDVLGGTLWVTPLPDGTVELAGPAEVVARGTVSVPVLG